MCKYFDTYLKLPMFFAVKQATTYIIYTKALLLLLDTAMY